MLSGQLFRYYSHYIIIIKKEDKEMIDPKDWLEFGQKFHGHKCPAMPMGLRVGAAAMNALGVERAKDGQLVAFVDLGEDHCATCYGDGLQVIMGTTFGKGNLKKTHKGKWAVTVVDPLVVDVMNAPAEMLLTVSPIFKYKLEPKKDSFDGFVCEECGEMTVMEYGRIKGGKKVCID
jgi:formylmethanofuran dehydrogenase subunit E